MRRLRPVVILAVSVIGLLVLWHRDPRIVHSYPPCPFFFLTHKYCPGCGSMRAAYSLLHGDIAKALSYNALLVACAPVLIYAAGSEAVELFRGKGLRQISLGSRTGKLIVGSVIAFWLLRNIPFYPFNLLAP